LIAFIRICRETSRQTRLTASKSLCAIRLSLTLTLTATQNWWFIPCRGNIRTHGIGTL
jgi:hypothetical protein